MDLREGYASIHHANLAWDADYERAIDKVAASGRASTLGVALWRAKYMNEAKAYRAALRMLARVLGGRHGGDGRALRERIATQCLREYIAPMCTTCLGVGEVVEKKLRIVCRTCNGVRVKWYSDRERALAMDISLAHARMLATKIRMAAETIEKADRQVNAVLVYQLERGI